MTGEAARPFEELFAHAQASIQAARDAGATLRLMGGLAVRQRATNLGGVDPATREYHDIDLVGRLAEVRTLDTEITALGYEPDRAVNTQFGTVRRVYYHPDGFHLDLFFEHLEFCHTIDLAGRLAADGLTLTPADLLLLKLQIVERNQKDVLDVYWLLLNHALSRGDSSQIELERITSLVVDDWGLYTTVQDFLSDATRLLPSSGLRPEAGEHVASQLGQLGEALTEAPKSLRWRSRARLGRRVRWYRVVEEVL